MEASCNAVEGGQKSLTDQFTDIQCPSCTLQYR
jgi:hypothetical protein